MLKKILVCLCINMPALANPFDCAISRGTDPTTVSPVFSKILTDPMSMRTHSGVLLRLLSLGGKNTNTLLQGTSYKKENVLIYDNHILVAAGKTSDQRWIIFALSLLEDGESILAVEENSEMKWIGNPPEGGTIIEAVIYQMMQYLHLSPPQKNETDPRIISITSLPTPEGPLRISHPRCPLPSPVLINNIAFPPIDPRSLVQAATIWPSMGNVQYILLNVDHKIGLLDVNGVKPIWYPDIGRGKNSEIEPMGFERMRIRIGEDHWIYHPMLQMILPERKENETDWSLRLTENGTSLLQPTAIRQQLENALGPGSSNLQRALRNASVEVLGYRYLVSVDRRTKDGQRTGARAAIVIDMRTDDLWIFQNDANRVRRLGPTPIPGTSTYDVLTLIGRDIGYGR